MTVFHISEIDPDDCAQCLITVPDPCGYHAGWEDGWGAACGGVAGHARGADLVDDRGL